MFGISLTEIVIIAVVALVVVGPKKLPGMLLTLGQWIRKLRMMTTQVRQQTGIDDILRAEGLEGGLSELRGILRGDLSSVGRSASPRGPVNDPYDDLVEQDLSREYPVEGPDAYDALPDDLIADLEPEPDRASAADAGAELPPGHEQLSATLARSADTSAPSPTPSADGAEGGADNPARASGDGSLVMSGARNEHGG